MTEANKDKANPRRVILVPHTHWDREWYFTTRVSKVLLLESLAVVLDELEAGRLPCFVLDGQTSLLEDYLLNAPHDRDRIARQVKAGRLKIGPWYSQTDQCVVGAESILRNLLYGVRDSREFGGHMEVGYVPDSFGQTEQLPQILAGFGLDRCVFWRGWWEGICENTEFEWVSRDGSSVTTAVIPTGYSGIKGMPATEGLQEFRFHHIRGHIETLEQRNVTASTLLMAGTDQQPWDPRFPGQMAEENDAQKDYRYEIGSMEQFFDALDQDGGLQTITAEMMMGKYSRIHRGIYSTRYDIKKANADAENLITHALEPILTVGWSLGFAYPHVLIERAWKLLLKSHAHDSIGCCNSDEVNAAVKQRLTDAREICEQQLQLRMRQIAERVRSRQEGQSLVLFNPLPEARTAPVEVELVVTQALARQIVLVDGDGHPRGFQALDCTPVHLSDLVQDLAEALLATGQSGDPLLYRHRLLVDAGELPALGYMTLYAQDLGITSNQTTVATTAATASVIENGRLRVTLEPEGTIALLDKVSGAEFSGLLEFADGGDDGDNYDFSPPREDWKISTRGQEPLIRARTGSLRSTIELQWTLAIPGGLKQRAAQTAEDALPVRAVLTLDRDADWLEVSVDVDNGSHDHRLQALFRTGLDTDVSYADQPFGMITRPNDPPELAEWPGEWTSKPLPLYPMQSVVALTDGKQGLAVLTDGIREYECDPDRRGDLALTLFRCVGAMGKPDLVYRPGRLSGMPTPTPDSQLQGLLGFRFALMPIGADPSVAARAARRFLSGVRIFQVSAYNKFSLNRGEQDLPDHYSVLKFDSPLAVSAVKKAEDREAIVLRAFNAGYVAQDTGRFSFTNNSLLSAARIRRVDFNEEPVAEHDTAATGHAAPQQAVTFLIEPHTASS